MSYLWVFIGGGLGSLFRYGIAKALAAQALNFPLATLLANILSCILLGFLVGYEMRSGLAIHWRLLLLTGFCGGFSTFSTFSFETFELFQTGQTGYALLNIGASLIICLGGIYLGMKLGS
ncbi:MAG: fluoride efflux transporter CrcB [Bacteroidota bacterium]